MRRRRGPENYGVALPTTVEWTLYTHAHTPKHTQRIVETKEKVIANRKASKGAHGGGKKVTTQEIQLALGGYSFSLSDEDESSEEEN